MFGLPGGIEWIIIGLIALLLFGKRLPEVMRSLGKGITEFKRGMKDVNDEVSNLTDVEATPKSLDAPEEPLGEEENMTAEDAPDASAVDDGDEKAG